MTVERIICCPAQIVGEVSSMLRHRATEKGLKLDVKFEGDIPKAIQTDPTRLRQVLINLIANAIKFTKQGGVTVMASITPSLRAVNPQLQIKIADTGIGISPEQQAALFQAFVQGDVTIARQYGGSGLGLAISRHFSRALGGDITVASEADKGSTFTVTVETGSLNDVEIHQNPEQAMDIKESFAGPNVRINGSILVAEDGIDNQALITARLRQTGLTVEIAPNGQIASEKALAAWRAEKPFDMILMDVQMPVMDGFTATLNMRSQGYRGPIIALTANAMDRDRDKCLQAGCNDFVTKPIQLEKLFKAMGKYLTVEQVKEQSKADAPVDREALAAEFFKELPDEIEQMQEAIEREDRVRLTEIAQLILGKAAAAGLKEIAPDAVRLMQSTEGESSWVVLGKAVKDFARSAQPKVQQAAA
jgi:Amt family ammonium transporter